MMFLFAQVSVVGNAGSIVTWIVLITIFLIHTLIRTAIISGISHVISMVNKNENFTFMKVFPYVFVVLFILGGIYRIYRFCTI